MLEVCQKESNSCSSAVAALTSELLVNIAVAGIKNGVLINVETEICLCLITSALFFFRESFIITQSLILMIFP